jgi:hypothetical protein
MVTGLSSVVDSFRSAVAVAGAGLEASILVPRLAGLDNGTVGGCGGLDNGTVGGLAGLDNGTDERSASILNRDGGNLFECK